MIRLSRWPGEPWSEFLNRAYHVAATWGVVVVVAGAATDGADNLIPAADVEQPAANVRLVGQGGTVPTGPLPIETIQFTTAGATGVSGPGTAGRGGAAGPGPNGPSGA